MRPLLQLTLLTGLCAATASAGLPITKALPYAGTIQSVDLANREVTFLGPDGQEMTLALPPHLLSAKEGPVELATLTEQVGKKFATFLRDETTAHLPILIEEPSKPIKGYVMRVQPEQQKIWLSTGDGLVVRLKPAVNLGAVDKVGEPAQRASWEWFEARVRRPFYYRTFDMAGMTFLYSVTPWDPKQDPEFEQPAEDAAE